MYGIREIAKYRDDKEKESQIFSELFFIKLYATIISLLGYTVLLIFFVPKESLLIYIILGMLLFFNIFNLDWYYSGIEEYKFISLRNISVKIFIFVLIIVFVKNQGHYILYAGLLILAQGLSNVLSFIHSRKYVKLRLKQLKFIGHLRVLKIFLASALVISVYNIVSTIILGSLTSSKEVAYFVRARQLQGIGIAITGAIATVLIPRITYYYNNDKEKYNELRDKSLNYNYVLSIPVMVGLMSLAKEINLLVGGNEFLPASKALIILAPLVVIITLGTWNYFQIWIPSGMEKIGVYFQMLMAVTSLGLNFILIPKYGYIGASIALLIAELVGAGAGIYYTNKKMPITIITKSLYKYIIASLLMLGVILILKGEINLLIVIILSGIIYGLSLFFMKEKIIIEMYKKLRRKIK